MGKFCAAMARYERLAGNKTQQTQKKAFPLPCSLVPAAAEGVWADVELVMGDM